MRAAVFPRVHRQWSKDTIEEMNEKRQDFRRLVLGCIDADFCNQILIFQQFSRTHDFRSYAPLRSQFKKSKTLICFVLKLLKLKAHFVSKHTCLKSVLGCIDADFCDQGEIFQRFSRSTNTRFLQICIAGNSRNFRRFNGRFDQHFV